MKLIRNISTKLTEIKNLKVGDCFYCEYDPYSVYMITDAEDEWMKDIVCTVLLTKSVEKKEIAGHMKAFEIKTPVIHCPNIKLIID